MIKTQTVLKRELTNLKKFGVKNPFQSEDVKNKIKQTNLKRYGVDHPVNNPRP